MTIIDELITLIDNLDDEGPNYLEIRTIKRMAHNLAKIQENAGGAA